MLLQYNFQIFYQKGFENTKADTLSRQQEYKGYKKERPQAILKKENRYLTYTHEIATIVIFEDYFQKARIKEVYTKDPFVEKQEEGENCTKDSQGLCRFKGLVYIPRTL